MRRVDYRKVTYSIFSGEVRTFDIDNLPEGAITANKEVTTEDYYKYDLYVKTDYQPYVNEEEIKKAPDFIKIKKEDD